MKRLYTIETASDLLTLIQSHAYFQVRKHQQSVGLMHRFLLACSLLEAIEHQGYFKGDIPAVSISFDQKNCLDAIYFDTDKDHKMHLDLHPLVMLRILFPINLIPQASADTLSFLTQVVQPNQSPRRIIKTLFRYFFSADASLLPRSLFRQQGLMIYPFTGKIQESAPFRTWAVLFGLSIVVLGSLLWTLFGHPSLDFMPFMVLASSTFCIGLFGGYAFMRYRRSKQTYHAKRMALMPMDNDQRVDQTAPKAEQYFDCEQAMQSAIVIVQSMMAIIKPSYDTKASVDDLVTLIMSIEQYLGNHTTDYYLQLCKGDQQLWIHLIEDFINRIISLPKRDCHMYAKRITSAYVINEPLLPQMIKGMQMIGQEMKTKQAA